MTVLNVQSSAESLLVTAAELAGMMQISTRTLWRLRSAGSIPQPVRLGGAVRWRRDELLDWMARGCPSVTSRENDTRRK